MSIVFIAGFLLFNLLQKNKIQKRSDHMEIVCLKYQIIRGNQYELSNLVLNRCSFNHDLGARRAHAIALGVTGFGWQDLGVYVPR